MTDDHRTLQINKIDAAQRQLQTAIRMWFYDIDPVSTHALAFAAYEVIHAVSKARNPDREDLLFDSKSIKPGERSKFIRYFKEPANFFKHADRDPDDSFAFTPGLTQILIFYAVHGVELCGEKIAAELLAFQYWLQIANPQILSEQARKVLMESGMIEHFDHLKRLSKHEFFEMWIHVTQGRRAS
ncbi:MULTISPECIES: hypothetical protein [unclassified Bradyrhizobium]